MDKQKEQIKQQVLDAFRFRHATKLYDETKLISDEDFEYILEAGRLSPSSLGSEPWKFLVVQDPAMRDKLMPLCPGAVEKLRTSSHFVILLSRKDVRYDSAYLRSQMKDIQQMPEEVIETVTGHYQNFQELHHLLENERTLADWSSKQTYIALGNMLTAAALIGIDSTPMEGFNADELEKLLAAEGLLGNGEFRPAVLAAFGYRKDEPGRPKMRRSLEEVVTFV
ncbi:MULTISPECIES: NAD(P)H-dependent oxidoreductase [unclassified Sporosarcina]|uniref:NAD(P)H-dependent oxidoreductase n=1 Tax=unclassified Sporosarcina TaxID=2647733 RepID=UPI0020408613|nr:MULTISPECIES: NAD(P)H-dependent oxidoreductase [unclassified Sporosarcina]GKV63907.1 putative NAD(P)H nitroreductase YfkO [Sporosarcina sp. NCCP-2331]GLB54687.1 putative NAD(P)H nitroreductase YfkO [Sporosarcina sp. NCCP-2378]